MKTHTPAMMSDRILAAMVAGDGHSPGHGDELRQRWGGETINEAIRLSSGKPVRVAVLEAFGWTEDVIDDQEAVEVVADYVRTMERRRLDAFADLVFGMVCRSLTKRSIDDDRLDVITSGSTDNPDAMQIDLMSVDVDGDARRDERGEPIRNHVAYVDWRLTTSRRFIVFRIESPIMDRLKRATIHAMPLDHGNANSVADVVEHASRVARKILDAVSRRIAKARNIDLADAEERAARLAEDAELRRVFGDDLVDYGGAFASLDLSLDDGFVKITTHRATPDDARRILAFLRDIKFGPGD